MRATNHLVDAMLALILMVGGVIGAQFGARAGQNMKAERLRLLLGLLVLGVGIRFAHRYPGSADRAVLAPLRGRRLMKRFARPHLALFTLTISPARRRAPDHLAQQPSGAGVLQLHRHRARAVRSDRARRRNRSTQGRLQHHRHRFGPARDPGRAPQGSRGRHLDQCRNPNAFLDAPPYLAVLSNKPLDEIAPAEILRRLDIGMNVVPRVHVAAGIESGEETFRDALIRLRSSGRLYIEDPTRRDLHHAQPCSAPPSSLPAEAPVGTYDVDVRLFADNAELARASSALEVVKVGVEQFIVTAARDHGILYGLFTTLMALLTGWFASIVFRRD